MSRTATSSVLVMLLVATLVAPRAHAQVASVADLADSTAEGQILKATVEKIESVRKKPEAKTAVVGSPMIITAPGQAPKPAGAPAAMPSRPVQFQAPVTPPAPPPPPEGAVQAPGNSPALPLPANTGGAQ